MFERIINEIPSQKDTGQYIGAIKEILGRTTFYISIINFFLLIVTAYYTTIRNFIPVSFIWFMVFVCFIIAIAMFFEYTVILPSSMVFNNLQAYKHTNPFKDDIQLILEKIDVINEKIEELQNHG